MMRMVKIGFRYVFSSLRVSSVLRRLTPARIKTIKAPAGRVQRKKAFVLPRAYEHYCCILFPYTTMKETHMKRNSNEKLDDTTKRIDTALEFLRNEERLFMQKDLYPMLEKLQCPKSQMQLARLYKKYSNSCEKYSVYQQARMVCLAFAVTGAVPDGFKIGFCELTGEQFTWTFPVGLDEEEELELS